jgi:hypothetical protein
MSLEQDISQTVVTSILMADGGKLNPLVQDLSIRGFFIFRSVNGSHQTRNALARKALATSNHIMTPLRLQCSGTHVAIPQDSRRHTDSPNPNLGTVELQPSGNGNFGTHQTA